MTFSGQVLNSFDRLHIYSIQAHSATIKRNQRPPFVQIGSPLHDNALITAFWAWLQRWQHFFDIVRKWKSKLFVCPKATASVCSVSLSQDIHFSTYNFILVGNGMDQNVIEFIWLFQPEICSTCSWYLLIWFCILEFMFACMCFDL